MLEWLYGSASALSQGYIGVWPSVVRHWKPCFAHVCLRTHRGRTSHITQGGSTRMATILIVDDARSTLRALEVILKREGYTVLTAASGTEGLTCIEQHEVDLLLCDVKMPKMDGLTVLRQVKAQDAGIAVVMMSGHGDISTAVSAMKEGAFDYLVKPFGEDEVLRVVQKALAMR